MLMLPNNSASEEFYAWCDTHRLFILERNDCSRVHHLKDAARNGKLMGDTHDVAGAANALNTSDEPKHVFVVKHDWAKAFGDADGFDDSFKLPYDVCAFEFRVGGRSLIAIAHYRDTDPVFAVFVQCGEYWICVGKTEMEMHLIQMVRNQLMATSIALDAEVATHTVERASHALNKKRIAAGKTPISDFHIVDLAKRHRIANPSNVMSEGTRKRLHFRRGHWRHYEASKTWIRWCLVGDPDLGFIHKEYTI